MKISLCGNITYINNFIKKMKELYGDKIVICNIFNIKFKIVVDTESIKYKLLDSSESFEKANKEYQNIVDSKTKEKINKLINDNRDKIIIIIDNNILTNCFTNTCYFKNSDIKILFEDIIDDINYDKSDFDYIFDHVDNINIKKLVKL